MPLLWIAGGLLALGGLAGSQIKDGADSIFKNVGGGTSSSNGGINKGELIFYLVVAAGALYVIKEGKEIL
jgi:hypothetical protein